MSLCSRSNSESSSDASPADGGGPNLAWLCGLLQASDSIYPTGSYAHSYGLEGLIQLGTVRDAASLRAYLQTALIPALLRVDLPLASQAYTALDPCTPDWAAVAQLSCLAHALKSAREAREASEKIGRQRFELLQRLRPQPLLGAYARAQAQDGFAHAAPVVAALEGRVLGAPAEAIRLAYAYATLAGTLAASMKLLRLGQNAAQTLLTESLLVLARQAARSADIRPEEIGWFNPWLDIAAARHESADARMFIS